MFAALSFLEAPMHHLSSRSPLSFAASFTGPLALATLVSALSNPAHAGAPTPPTTIAFVNDESRVEQNANLTFTLELDVAATAAFDVVVSTSGGDAVAGADYTALVGTVVSFAIGDTSKTVDVGILEDDIDELNETFTIGVVSTTSVTVVLDGSELAIGTIDDDDAQPDLDPVAASFNEGAGTASITVSLNRASSRAITVEFATSDDTALSPGDYAATSGVLQIDPGALFGTVDVPLVNDNVDEDDQDFVLTLANAANAGIGDPTATMTITDNDLPPTVSASPLSVGEAAGTVQIAVTLSAASEFQIAIDVDTTAITGEAAIPGDLTDINTALVFLPGDTTKNVALTVTDDNVHEDDEDVSLVLDVTAGGPTDVTQTLTIVENEPRPVVNITRTQDAVEAGNEAGNIDDAIFSVTLSGASESTVTVDVSTANGTAVAVQDFDAVVAQTVSFAPGDLTETVNVDSNNDALDEDLETFTLVPSNVSAGADLGTSASATITDDDLPPTISVNDAQVLEGEGNVTLSFSVTLSAASGRTLSVAFDTADGTALAATDFVDTTQTVSFAPGDPLTKTVDVIVSGDLSDEDNETFAVALSTPVNVTLGDAAGVGTINDNDNPPVVSIAGSAVGEGNAGTVNLPFTVSLSVASGKTVTVTATTSDGSARQPVDYASRTQLLTIPPNTASVPFNVVVNGDGTFEGNDTVNATLTAPGNATIGTSTALGTITNDDPIPTLDVSNATLNVEGNAGVRNLPFTISLSNPSDQITTFNFRTSDSTATAGFDYSAQDTNAIITAGATSTVINVVVAGDTLDEPDENLLLLVTGASGANIGDGEGVGTIVDDDETPTLAVVNPSPAFEGNTGTANLRFDVVLSAPSGQEVRVNVQTVAGTASPGADFIGKPLNQLIFNPGVTVQAVNVTVLADVLDEDDLETFTLPLSTPINAVLAAGNAATGTGSIRDDDATPTLEINDVTLAPEGNIGTEPATFTVTLSAPSGRTVTYSFATEDGDATAETDYFPQSGVRQLAPGTVSETITIDVLRETAEEGDEIFSVVLSDVQNAVLLDGSGICVILNDDDGPVTGPDGPFTVVEEQVLVVPQPGVLVNDSDADGDPLFAELRDDPNPALEGTLQFLPDGGFSFTPVSDFSGAVTFSYVATDGVNDSAPRVVTINVTNLNDAPLLDTATITHAQDEDDPDPPSLLIDELAFDAIVDFDIADLPGIAIVDVPAAADGTVEMSLDDGATWISVLAASASAAVLVPPEALLRLNPPPDAAPTAVVTFRAWDGSDGAPVGPDNPAVITGGDDAPFSAATAEIEFVVSPVNDAPVFTAPTPQPDEPVAAGEGVTTTIQLGAADVDDDAGDLTFALEEDASTLPASAAFDATTARLTLTPAFFEAGAYVVRFVVTDPAGASDTRDVAIQIAFNDGDLDGLPDSWEADVGLDPQSGDTDDDTISDLDEAGDIGLGGDLGELLDPVDTDDDGTPDAADDDADGDGVLDRFEAGDDRLDTPPVTSDGDDTADFRDENADDDDFEDFADNCRTVPNNDQGDLEEDGIGDACDPDGDGDRLADDLEPELGLSDENPDADGDTILDGDEIGDPSEPSDSDGDGDFDALEQDSDGDDVSDAEEAGDDEPGTLPVDTDEDGLPDFQDTDSDDDDVLDDRDNCRVTKNTDQVDQDQDGVGDACLQVCGDGRVQAPEECDDGNTTSGDLCDADCQNECDQAEVCDGLDQDCDGLIDLVASPGGGLASVCEDRDITVGGGGLLSACGCSSGPDASLPLFAVALLALAARARRRRVGAGAGAFALVVLATGAAGGAWAAAGDGMQVQQFTPVGGGAEDLVLVEGTGVNGHLRPAAGLYLDYSYATLNVRDDLTNANVALLEHHVGATVVGSLSLFDRGQIALQVPLTAFQAAGVDDIFIPATLSPVALGDIRVSGRFSILDAAQPTGPGLAAGAAVTTWTGDPAQLQGYGFFTVEPKLMGGWRFGRARVLANLGYLIRPRQRILGFEVGNEVTWGVGGSFAALPQIVDAVAEVNGRIAADLDIPIEGPTSPLETLVGARWHVLPGHDVTAGLTLGITSGYGTPLFRVFAGYTFTLPGPATQADALAAAAVPEDEDGDLIAGAADLCPAIAEDKDGIQDADGCPDVDADEDGLPDNVDRCPELAEDKDGFEDGDGCADLDDDNDAIALVDDKCPALAEDKDGFEDGDGCPDDDNDRDGVADAADKCPNQAGPLEGCLSAVAAPVATGAAAPGATVELPQRIYFQSNGIEVTAEGQRFLEEIAAALKKNDSVRVEVQGHSDAQGEDAVNDELSLMRAKAVVDLLVKAGIARQRFLIVVLAGNEPLAPNDTPQGRAMNRRVQFRVLPP